MALSDLVPEFAAVASRSPIGIFSPVFETEFGLHFLRVNARRGERIDYNHILIAFDERKSDPEEAISLLTTLRDSILTHGARFEVLAREFSEEEMSRARGGRVSDPQSGEQNLYIDALGPLWQQTLAGLEPDEISEPSEVQLLDGRQAYHIVKLHKRIPEHTVSLETDYALIEQLALQEKQAEVLSDWMDRLKRTVHIEYRGRASDLAAATN
jgi:peptidyl-prolyl cis-trans isomerase SurA